MTEEWREIKETNGDYSVSNLGRVRSNNRIVIGSKNKIKIKERILRPAIDQSGYLRVAIVINGKLVTRKVHRLVASEFNLNPLNKTDVNHKDGIKKNNISENLEWSSRSENVLHSYRMGLQIPKRGTLNSSSKIDEIKALTVITCIKHKFKRKEVVDKLGITTHIYKDIQRGKTWNHLQILN